MLKCLKRRVTANLPVTDVGRADRTPEHLKRDPTVFTFRFRALPGTPRTVPWPGRWSGKPTAVTPGSILCEALKPVLNWSFLETGLQAIERVKFR
jgi:hypothetical protein